MALQRPSPHGAPEGSDGFVEWANTRSVPTRRAHPNTLARQRRQLTLDLDLRGARQSCCDCPDDSGPHDNAVQFMSRLKTSSFEGLAIAPITTAFARALAPPRCEL